MENQSNAKTPTDFLSTVLGQTVKVRLNSGIDYKGKRSEHQDVMKVGFLRVIRWGIRNFGLFRWLHEHCIGKHRRIRRRKIKEHLW